MQPNSTTLPPRDPPAGHALEVGAAFLRLGLTSFGGPVAHVGYFHREFVVRRRWLDDEHFGQLLALAQFLPGPASSQLGFSLGMLRAGLPGALAAFLAFPLPSALLMFAFAIWSTAIGGAWGQGLLHGLKLLAVAIVAQGVVAMARSLCPDWPRRFIAAAAVAMSVAITSSWSQLAVVAGGALLGGLACRHVVPKAGAAFSLPYGRVTGAACLMAYAMLLVAAMVLAPLSPPWGQLAGAFYRTGALVFGGGHVVLPLLKEAVVDPGWVTQDTFLSGYGAAQAVPGPMFTLSAFLGERAFGGDGRGLHATVAVLAIFLPGLLMVSGVLPFWRMLAANTMAARLLAGINAAVVGLLASALYNPVWVGAIRDMTDVAVALVAFAGLMWARWPALVALAWCVAIATLRSLLVV